MNRLIPTSSRLFRQARLLCALMLSLTFLSAGTLLVASSSSSPSPCERACCAGKAPHAAGSCAHGACHASLPSRRKSSNHGRRIRQPIDQLCGVPRRVQTASSLQKASLRLTGGTPGPRARANSDQTRVSVASLSSPCQPGCGVASSVNASQRNAATLSHHRRPQPLRDIRLNRLDHSASSVLDALSGQCSPRGPPISFS